MALELGGGACRAVRTSRRRRPLFSAVDGSASAACVAVCLSLRNGAAMTELLEAYAKVTGEDVIDHLRQLTESMRGMSVVHVNSTRVGGGVAEILHKLVPLMNE